jgi:hypothetical protein
VIRARRGTIRLSASEGFGPFRIGGSIPLFGRGRARVFAGRRVGRRGWLGVSAPVGQHRERGRR